MKKVFKRLQGEDWHKLKENLKPFKYITNEKGHVKGFYKSEDGKVYSHWLNDIEILELKEGGK